MYYYLHSPIIHRSTTTTALESSWSRGSTLIHITTSHTTTTSWITITTIFIRIVFIKIIGIIRIFCPFNRCLRNKTNNEKLCIKKLMHFKKLTVFNKSRTSLTQSEQVFGLPVICTTLSVLIGQQLV